MRISTELDDLIDHAIEDDYKISSKEKEVLISKAINEGIDKNEFEIYLNARVHKARRGVGKDSNLFSRLIKKYLNYSKDNPIFSFQLYSIIFFIFFGFLFFKGCKGCMNYLSSEEPKEINYSVIVDSLLVINKFSEALNAASKTYDPNATKLKVIKSELNYWIGQKDFERAFLIISEMKTIGLDDLYYGVYRLNKVMYESYIVLIKACCTFNQFDKANLFINQMPDKIEIDNRSIYVSDEDGKIKYNNIKAGIKPNEEIDSYKGLNESYDIHAYAYPKKESMQILIDSKKTLLTK